MENTVRAFLEPVLFLVILILPVGEILEQMHGIQTENNDPAHSNH